MPHLQMSEEALAARHPSILAPPEEPLHGFAHNASDHVYQHRLALAQQIESDIDVNEVRIPPASLPDHAGTLAHNKHHLVSLNLGGCSLVLVR